MLNNNVENIDNDLRTRFKSRMVSILHVNDLQQLGLIVPDAQVAGAIHLGDPVIDGDNDTGDEDNTNASDGDNTDEDDDDDGGTTENTHEQPVNADDDMTIGVYLKSWHWWFTKLVIRGASYLGYLPPQVSQTLAVQEAMANMMLSDTKTSVVANLFNQTKELIDEVADPDSEPGSRVMTFLTTMFNPIIEQHANVTGTGMTFSEFCQTWRYRLNIGMYRWVVWGLYRVDVRDMVRSAETVMNRLIGHVRVSQIDAIMDNITGRAMELVFGMRSALAGQQTGAQVVDLTPAPLSIFVRQALTIQLSVTPHNPVYIEEQPLTETRDVNVVVNDAVIVGVPDRGRIDSLRRTGLLNSVATPSHWFKMVDVSPDLGRLTMSNMETRSRMIRGRYLVDWPKKVSSEPIVVSMKSRFSETLCRFNNFPTLIVATDMANEETTQDTTVTGRIDVAKVLNGVSHCDDGVSCCGYRTTRMVPAGSKTSELYRRSDKDTKYDTIAPQYQACWQHGHMFYAWREPCPNRNQAIVNNIVQQQQQ